MRRCDVALSGKTAYALFALLLLLVPDAVMLYTLFVLPVFAERKNT